MNKSAKPINIPISLKALSREIPPELPVNYEFEFCEDCPEPIILALIHNPHTGYKDAVDIVINNQKRKVWRKAPK